MRNNNAEVLNDFLDLSKYTRYKVIRFAPEIELIGELMERTLEKPIEQVFPIMEILVYNLHDWELTEIDIKEYYNENNLNLDEVTLEEILILSDELSEMLLANNFDGSLYIGLLKTKSLVAEARKYATIDDLRYINGCYEIYYSLFKKKCNSFERRENEMEET